MSSNHVEDFLTDYIDGALTSPTLDRVKSHLVFCTDCRQLHHDIEKNILKLKQTPTLAPPTQLEKKIIQTLSEKSIDLISQSKLSRPTWIQWLVSFRGMSLAGASILLIFVIFKAPEMTQESKKEIGQLNQPSSDTAEHQESRAMEMLAPDPKKSIVNEIPSAVRASGTMEKGNVGEMAPTKSTNEDKRNTPFLQNSELATPLKSIPQSLGAIKTTNIDDNQVYSGFSSGISQPLEKVISDPKTWQDFWDRHQRFHSPADPLPNVDFDNKEVIAIFAGEQPTLGFRIEITRVISTQWENAPARVVRYRVISPPPDAIVGLALSQPFVIKVVPKSTGPTFFKKIR